MYQYLFGWITKEGLHYRTFNGDSREEAIRNFKQENGNVKYRIFRSDDPKENKS